MYKNCKTRVRCAVGTTTDFYMKVRLHQGSALSPFLFAIVMDSLTEQIQKVTPWDMMFADDVSLCGNSCEEVEEHLEEWHREMENRGLKVSRQKTEYLCMGEPGTTGGVWMEGERLKEAKEFKYLGSTVQQSGDSDKEVIKRIQAGWAAWRRITGVMCNRHVPGKVKGRMFKTMVRPAMLYGIWRQ